VVHVKGIPVGHSVENVGTELKQVVPKASLGLSKDHHLHVRSLGFLCVPWQEEPAFAERAQL
jgi:hypothetical protein